MSKESKERESLAFETASASRPRRKREEKRSERKLTAHSRFEFLEREEKRKGTSGLLKFFSAVKQQEAREAEEPVVMDGSVYFLSFA